jgi:hypothetical protein
MPEHSGRQPAGGLDPDLGLLGRLGVAGGQVGQPPLVAGPAADPDHVAFQPGQRRAQRRLARFDDRPLDPRVV